jgi:hypothetical protein
MGQWDDLGLDFSGIWILRNGQRARVEAREGAWWMGSLDDGTPMRWDRNGDADGAGERDFDLLERPRR